MKTQATPQKNKVALAWASFSPVKRGVTIAVAAVLLAAIVFGIVWSCLDHSFRYEKEDLSGYLTIDLAKLKATPIELTPKIGDSSSMETLTAAKMYAEIAKKIETLDSVTAPDGTYQLALGDKVKVTMEVVKETLDAASGTYEPTTVSTFTDKEIVLGEGKIGDDIEKKVLAGVKWEDRGSSDSKAYKTFTFTDMSKFAYTDAEGKSQSIDLSADVQVQIRYFITEAKCLTKANVTALDAKDDGYAVTAGIEDTDAAYAADYRAHLFRSICNTYVDKLGENYRNTVLSEVWSKLFEDIKKTDGVTIAGYPEDAIEEYEDYLVKQFRYYYENGTTTKDSKTVNNYEVYDDWKAYALAEYFEEDSLDVPVEDCMRAEAEEFVAKRMLICVIARAADDFTAPTSGEIDDYLDAYNAEKTTYFNMLVNAGLNASYAEYYAESSYPSLSEEGAAIVLMQEKAGYVLLPENEKYAALTWVNPIAD